MSSSLDAFLLQIYVKAGEFMKKINKILSLVMTFSMMSTVVFASAEGGSVGAIESSVQSIVNAVSYFGYAIAMAMLAFLGVKYALSPANEKADVKQGSINYLIGAFFIICASTVANIVVGIAASGGADASGMASSIIQAAQTAAGSGG